jgi:predicted metal-dependent HD superfamily phosphohydrolase
VPLPSSSVDVLRSRFLTSCTKLFSSSSSPSSSLLETTFEDLLLRHQEPQRFYHTTRHLEEIFEVLDVLDPVDSSGVLAMSTFFHDAIYDPRSGTNEEDSAVLFEAFAEAVEGAAASPNCAKVAEYIRATRHHNVSESTDESLKIFVDADMSVLGKCAEGYNNYAGLIRLEYAHYERSDYCQGRAKVLTTFLEQENIFASKRVHGASEARARMNIKREINSLLRGVIPGERGVDAGGAIEERETVKEGKGGEKWAIQLVIGVALIAATGSLVALFKLRRGGR